MSDTNLLGEREPVLVWLKVFLVTWFVWVLPTQALSTIGEVLSVKPGAEITRAGNTQPLRQGMQVASGDAISTNSSGVVQLIFVDETKIAIGPNARMTLDVTMLRGNRKAKSFAVQALGGSFRFISGKSRKRAYSIKTPTATMAVRGTIFDMWVVPGSQSAMVVLEGTVRMCGLRGGCRSTGRQCSIFATSQRGNVGRPVDQREYEKALQLGFPFIESQARLLRPFQAEVEGCAREAAPVRRAKSDAPEPRQRQASKPAAKPAPAVQRDPFSPRDVPAANTDPGR